MKVPYSECKATDRAVFVSNILLVFSILPHVASLLSAENVVAHAQHERSLRLPNTTKPNHYHLHILSRLHREEFRYQGNVTIDITVIESTNEIVLHAKNLSDFVLSVHNLVTGESLDDLRHTYVPHGNLLVIHAIENYQVFEKGQQLRLQILFTGILNEKTFGIYWYTYKDAANETVYLLATQFEPTSARLAFPCYDEPAFKANFTIELTHSDRYTAISNMHVLDTSKFVDEAGKDNDLVTTKFHTTPPMSTYLVAFVISNFEYISEEYRGVMQRIFTAPTVKDKGQKALKNAVRAVATMEDYFGISYPLAKLDHIALEKNYGAAMENWGLITYREDNLVHQDESDVHKMLKDIITQNHEIAHQWFGNLVSPEWWSFAWLNEGFATYFGFLITDLLYPEMKAMEFFLTDTVERAYTYGNIAVRPMTHYAETESEISGLFDIIIYQRAACVIRMFHHAFNQKTFVRGIGHYLSKYQYSVANEIQLFDGLQVAVSNDPTLTKESWARKIHEIMLSWTHSEWIPIVSVLRNLDNQTITIRQRSKDLNSIEHWWIPLNFATPLRPNFEQTRVDYFMPAVPEVTLPIEELQLQFEPGDWLIVNKMQTGFYHVLYDDENLYAIAQQLQKNHTAIHHLNRGAIFQDLCSLIENNEIQNVNTIFELLKYLEYERNFIPWNSVADTIKFLERNLFGTIAHQPYKSFIHQLVSPVFRQLFEPLHHQNLTSIEILARQKILDIACMADVQGCLNFTHKLAHAYIFNNIKFDQDLTYYGMHDSIMCLGVKYLSDEEFEAVIGMLARTDSATIWYDDLLYALRCTESPRHLQQFLNLLFGENSTSNIMDDNDSMMYVFFLFKSSMSARPVVLNFFQRHYKLLCHSEYFVENFNRIAEYIPMQNRQTFIELHDAITAELQSPENNFSKSPIALDSQRIGKKVRMSEEFRRKFSDQIHEWLLQEQMLMPVVRAAASVSVRSAANRPASLLSGILAHL